MKQEIAPNFRSNDLVTWRGYGNARGFTSESSCTRGR